MIMNNSGLKKVYDNDDRTTELKYENDFLTEIKNPLGEITYYTYDENGLLLTRKNHDKKVKITNKYETDKNSANYGRVIEQKDAKNHVTKYSYTTDMETDYLTVKITDRCGNIVYVTSDKQGNIVNKTDAYGVSTVFMYNEKNEMLSLRQGNGYVTTYTYDDSGNMTNVHEVYSGYTEGEMDSEDVSINNDIEAIDTKMEYDKKGNVVKVIDTNGKITKTTYNEKNLVTEIKYSSGEVLKYTYNKNNQVLTETVGDSNGKTLGVKEYHYDDNSFLEYVKDMVGNTNSYEYDSRGNTVKLTGSNGLVTKYKYDKLNRVTSESTLDENGKVYKKVKYTYDVDGNQTSVIVVDAMEIEEDDEDQNSVTKETDSVTKYVYDENGELVSIKSPTNTVTYTKDNEGRILSQKFTSGNETTETERTYTYDKIGQLVSETDEEGNTTSYTYDKVGNLKTITDPNGNVTKNTYFLNGKLYEVTRVNKEDKTKNTVTRYTYDNRWNVANIFVNGKLKTSYEYDSVGNMTKEHSAVELPDGKIQNIDTLYEYDVYGRLIKTTDPNGNVTENTFDEEGRLTSVKNALEETTCYEYDQLGNITSVSRKDENRKILSLNYSWLSV